MPEEKARAAEGSQRMGALLDHFAALEDARVERARAHSVRASVTIALCGVIGGAQSGVEIAEFGRITAEWFATLLDCRTASPRRTRLGGSSPTWMRRSLQPVLPTGCRRSRRSCR